MDIAALNALIGKKIKEFRDFKDMSQEELAVLVKVNRSTISQVETGNQQITIGLIYSIAEQLHTEINTFLPPLSSMEIKSSSVIHLLEKEVADDNIDESTKNSILGLIKKKPDDDK